MLDARVLDAAPFGRATLDALYAAIEVNDRVDADAEAPAAIRLDYDRAELIDGFRLSRQLWREGFDRTALIEMAATLGRADAFGPEEQSRFKQVRAKFKHLRFAFVLYAADHRCPPMFKAVTTTMGHLQDAFGNGRHSAAARHAALLRLSLARLPQMLLSRETDRLAPSDPADFRRFVLAQMTTLREMLERDRINAHGFHAARKIVSRQVSFHDDMRTLRSDPRHDAMSRCLAAINGLMGRFHDTLVLRRTRGELDYARAAFAFPADIRQRLEALVALYR